MLLTKKLALLKKREEYCGITVKLDWLEQEARKMPVIIILFQQKILVPLYESIRYANCNYWWISHIENLWNPLQMTSLISWEYLNPWTPSSKHLKWARGIPAGSNGITIFLRDNNYSTWSRINHSFYLIHCTENIDA